MDKDAMEFKVLLAILNETHQMPTVTEYKRRVKGTKFSQWKAISQNYGSFSKAVQNFEETYQQMNSAFFIPDYFLGAMVGHIKIIRKKNFGVFLRFITGNENELSRMISFMHHFSVTNQLKNNDKLKYIRCRDHDLILALERMDFENNPPFRPTIDFVRGYIEFHSSLRRYGLGNRRVRMTLSGPLVAECHEFLIRLGANETRVLQVKRENSSIKHISHIQNKSLRVIRDSLYPKGCICIPQVRDTIYLA